MTLKKAAKELIWLKALFKQLKLQKKFFSSLFQMNINKISWLFILLSCDIDKSIYKECYATCIEWTKLFKIENHLQSIQSLHAVNTASFESMYQICLRWLHVKVWMF